MKNFKNIFYILPLSLAIACAPEFDDLPAPSQGSADFSNYVAVGNSLTAGYQSNALSADGQLNSFPAIIAEQMKTAGGGEHRTPLLTGDYGARGSGLDAIGANLIVPALKLDYTTDCTGATGLGPVLDGAPFGSAAGFFGSLDRANNPGPYNNYAVPGAKSYHLGAPGYGNVLNLPNANPYYVRFVNATDQNETVINATISANPSFFSLWIGNNDVLSYATSGGSGQDHNATGNTNPATYGGNDITHNAAFAGVYSQLIAGLTANGAKGVVANIPDVTSIPFFTTVRYNDLTLDASSAAALNAAYAGYNQGLQNAAMSGAITQEQADLKTLSFAAGDNAFVIEDKAGRAVPGLPNIRQALPRDLILLTVPGDSIRCAGWGSQKAIPGQFVLDKTETDALALATASYNQTIKAAADANDLAFVDANAILADMEKGLAFDGVTYSTTFVTGGSFSLDGVHPNTAGYAIIANAHIDAINAKYGSSIPRVSVNAYQGTVFP